jgi:hypothetical protein
VTVPSGGASITSTAFISEPAELLASTQRTSVCVGRPERRLPTSWLWDRHLLYISPGNID